MQKRKLAQVGLEAVEKLDLPPEVAAGAPQVELCGNMQLYMAGHRGVLACGTEQVDINGGCLIVRVRGEDLQLLAMTEQELRLGGRITEVELVE